jgi:hypothetical protein
MMKLWKKIVLIPPLLFALWLLADKQNGSSFAVVVALSRHPPSLRVYRALLEVGLMLLCGSLSLIVWEYAAGTRVVGILLFRPPQPIQTSIRGIYQAVPASLPDDDNALTEEEAQDACYASDGEVQEEEDVEYSEPPTAASIAHSAVDLLLLVLVSLFLFTISSAEGGKYIEGMTTIQWVASIAAPVFPLLLFLWAVFKAFFPLSKRRDFWTVVAYTPSAPMLQVTFRYVSLFRHYTQHSTLTLFVNLLCVVTVSLGTSLHQLFDPCKTWPLQFSTAFLDCVAGGHKHTTWIAHNFLLKLVGCCIHVSCLHVWCLLCGGDFYKTSGNATIPSSDGPILEMHLNTLLQHPSV